MKILLTTKLNNPNQYVDNVFEAVSSEAEVVVGVDNFWYSTTRFDIVHFQWPEELFYWNQPNEGDIVKLTSRLDDLKSEGVKFIGTMHNEMPHKKWTLGETLYKKVYEYLDGLIHFGEYSITLFEELYPNLDSIKHCIIEHPYYKDLDEKCTTKLAKKKLGFETQELLFVVPGKIRFKEEQALVVSAFKAYRKHNKKARLFITRAYRESKQSLLKSPIKRVMWELQNWAVSRIWPMVHHINCSYNLLSEADLQTVVKAADVVIIPRLKVLNSGVFYLAKSFDKIVIGPKLGNLSEHLNKRNDLYYTPNSSKSLTKRMFESMRARSKEEDKFNNTELYKNQQLKVALDLSKLYLKV